MFFSFKRKPQATDYSERRQYVRIHSHFPLKILDSMGNETFQITNLRDISVGGIKFKSGQPLEINQRRKIMLFWAERTMTLSFDIEMMWCRKIENENCYHIGARFVGLGEHGTELLRQWIEPLVPTHRDNS